MKIVTRMLQAEIAAAVAVTTIAFVGLLLFFDLVGESRFITRSNSDGYGLLQVATHLALSVPMHLYRLLPICVLIGTIFVMVRYARTSQFTILRTSGLGPGRALGILLSIGLVFTAITFVLGDYAAPWAERSAQLLRAQYLGGQIVAGRGQGAWMRERQGDDLVIVSVTALRTDGEAQGIRVFQFAPDGRLLRQLRAESAEILPGAWQLRDAREEVLPPDFGTPALQADGSLLGDTPAIRVDEQQSMRWPTSITADMVNAAILDPDGMSTLQLANYVRHLRANEQASQRFELELWRKVFYPLGCLVMIVLALPFAYLHFRSGGMVGPMFVGILVGISYLLISSVFGYIGNLRGWPPLLTSIMPALLYSTLALGAFLRMVRQR